MLVSTIFTMFYWGDWRVALVVLGFLPVTGALMSVAMASMMPMDQGKQGKQDKDGEQNKSAGAIVGEVVLGIRTVASFCAERQFYADYSTQADQSQPQTQTRPRPQPLTLIPTPTPIPNPTLSLTPTGGEHSGQGPASRRPRRHSQRRGHGRHLRHLWFAALLWPMARRQRAPLQPRAQA
jgi:ABC-type multidrug transport system fused ATPase/permease subunit